MDFLHKNSVENVKEELFMFASNDGNMNPTSLAQRFAFEPRIIGEFFLSDCATSPSGYAGERHSEKTSASRQTI